MGPGDIRDARQRTASPPIAKLGFAQLVVLLSGLATVFTVTGVLSYRSLYEEFIKAVAIEPFEPRFGFRTGPVVVHRSGQGVETSWGIVSVIEDGEFARAGVRSGDIPFGRHSGVIELYGALHQAASGESTWFECFNAGDVDLGVGALREIRLPAGQASIAR